MEDKTFMIPPIGGKSILRSTGEEVEIIDAEIKERGARNDEDWVTYIDSDGKEHIKEHLNMQLDFKPVVNDTWNKVFDLAKELVKNGSHVSSAVSIAKQLVDEVGIETE